MIVRENIGDFCNTNFFTHCLVESPWPLKDSSIVAISHPQMANYFEEQEFTKHEEFLRLWPAVFRWFLDCCLLWRCKVVCYAHGLSHSLSQLLNLPYWAKSSYSTTAILSYSRAAALCDNSCCLQRESKKRALSTLRDEKQLISSPSLWLLFPQKNGRNWPLLTDWWKKLWNLTKKTYSETWQPSFCIDFVRINTLTVAFWLGKLLLVIFQENLGVYFLFLSYRGEFKGAKKRLMKLKFESPRWFNQAMKFKSKCWKISQISMKVDIRAY